MFGTNVDEQQIRFHPFTKVTTEQTNPLFPSPLPQQIVVYKAMASTGKSVHSLAIFFAAVLR